MQPPTRQNFVPSTYYYAFGPHPPALTLASGGSVRVVCADCDNRLPDGSVVRAEQKHVSPGSPYFYGNPMVGPIAIDGADVGDVIAVRIERIDISPGIGRTGIGPGHGLLPAHHVSPDGAVPKHLYEWKLDPTTNRATLENRLGPHPIEIAMKPFIGCIGVAPEHGQQIATLFAGTHGGNMDLPSIAAGATLYLPVFAPGALLMLGDLHARQGHGEAIGGAIETPGEVEIAIELLKQRACTENDWCPGATYSLTRADDSERGSGVPAPGHPSIPAPRIRTATEIGAVASDGDLRVAIQLGFSRLIAWLADELTMNRFDAFNLLSQTARIEIGNLVNSPFSVAVFVAVEVLPSEARIVLEGMK